MRELDRRVKDLDDRTRYLLVSTFSPRFALYDSSPSSACSAAVSRSRHVMSIGAVGLC